MNKFLRTILTAVCLLLSGTFNSFAGTTTISVYVIPSPAHTGTQTSPDPEYLEIDEYGQRKPARHIACSIASDSGIEFLGQETPDFIFYEIYDSNNACVGAYGDESEFLNALFSLTGEYRISLSTAEVSYMGYVLL